MSHAHTFQCGFANHIYTYTLDDATFKIQDQILAEFTHSKSILSYKTFYGTDISNYQSPKYLCLHVKGE